MAGIIVAFSKAEEGRNVRNLLMKKGYNVAAVCTSGAQVIAMADSLKNGVIVCGYKFADMMYTDIYHETGEFFEMIMLANPGKIYEGEEKGISYIYMPFKVKDFLNTLEMQLVISERRYKKSGKKPKPRTEEEKKIINEAKAALIEVNNMTENEAHKYIQRKSMNSGDSLVDTAKIILENLYRE